MRICRKGFSYFDGFQKSPSLPGSGHQVEHLQKCAFEATLGAKDASSRRSKANFADFYEWAFEDKPFGIGPCIWDMLKQPETIYLDLGRDPNSLVQICQCTLYIMMTYDNIQWCT